eukprot:2958562-Pleurochrysis_carterae.AAC.1
MTESPMPSSRPAVQTGETDALWARDNAQSVDEAFKRPCPAADVRVLNEGEIQRSLAFQTVANGAVQTPLGKKPPAAEAIGLASKYIRDGQQ